MAIEITGAISSFSAAMGLLRGAIDARDDAKIKEAVMDMSSRLFIVHQEAQKLTVENENLQAECRRLKEEASDRESFVLHEVRTGAFALRYQPVGDSQATVHYICQACKSLGQKVVLRLDNPLTGPELCCPVNEGHKIYVGEANARALFGG